MSTNPETHNTPEPIPAKFESGFFSEASARGAVGRWKDGNRVRFKNGLPQKIGGWVNAEVGGVTYRGLTRRLHEWSSLDGQNWVAEGTSRKLYLINNGTRYDITPIRRTVTLIDPFDTTDLSATVVVEDAGHNAQAGDFVRFSGASAGGGITIDGEYTIVAITDGDHYTITHSAPATSTVAGTGGTVVVNYDISVGRESNQSARGYGTCGYGEGTYGTPRAADCSGLVSGLRLWSLDNFGEDLIASPRGGAIYWWDRSLGVDTRAKLLENAPPINERVLMSQTGGRVICLGAYDLVANVPDPMFIVASEEGGLLGPFREVLPGEEDNDVYVERASKGSHLITGVSTRSGTLIFSDTALYMLVPDFDQIFDLRTLAEGDTVVGPNAAIEVSGTVYFMGAKKFLRFDGVLSEIPCPVWGHIFDSADAGTPGFNAAQADKVYCWYNEDFDEIWWHYPSRNSTENDRCVIFQRGSGDFYYLAIERTAGMHEHVAFDSPITVGITGLVYQHEVGTDDDTSPMNEYIESHDIQVGDGKSTWHISNFVPDFKRQTGTLQLTLKGKDRPQQSVYVTFGPTNFTSADSIVGVRAAGRQIALRLASTALGTDWRFDNGTLYGQPDGEHE